MMQLNELSRPKGAIRKRRRVGRGSGTGRGKTCGRGQKGERSRSGQGRSPGFEGGQMPIQRRLPKRGFVNPCPRSYEIVNVGALDRFEKGDVVDLELLQARGIVRKSSKRVKILGKGKLSKSLTVRGAAFSRGAREKIEKRGGTIEELS